MEEIKKAIMSGVSERPEVGVGRTMTPTDKAILMLVLVLGARQNLMCYNKVVTRSPKVI